MDQQQVLKLRFVAKVLRRIDHYLWRTGRLTELLYRALDRYLPFSRFAARVFKLLARLERCVKELRSRVAISQHVLEDLLLNPQNTDPFALDA